MTYSTTALPTALTAANKPALVPAGYHRSGRHPVFAMPAAGRSGRLIPPPVRTERHSSSRTRLVAVLAIIVFIVVIISSGVGADSGPVPTSRHHVAAGETLWGLASAITPQGESVWDYVALLKDLNGLETSSLRVDQVLLVPTASQ